MTHSKYLLELIDADNDDKTMQFIEQFYPNGAPEWTVVIDETYKDEVYCQNKVYADGEYVDTVLRRKEEGGEFLETYLNTITEYD